MSHLLHPSLPFFSLIISLDCVFFPSVLFFSPQSFFSYFSLYLSFAFISSYSSDFYISLYHTIHFFHSLSVLFEPLPFFLTLSSSLVAFFFFSLAMYLTLVFIPLWFFFSPSSSLQLHPSHFTHCLLSILVLVL